MKVNALMIAQDMGLYLDTSRPANTGMSGYETSLQSSKYVNTMHETAITNNMTMFKNMMKY